MRAIEQEFATPIYKNVETYGEEHKKGTSERDQYVSTAQELPILIRTAGLAEALAFTESRKDEPPKALLDHLSSVLGYADRKALLEQSRKAEMQEYLYLTRRAMLALKWFKRFAQSVLDL